MESLDAWGQVNKKGRFRTPGGFPPTVFYQMDVSVAVAPRSLPTSTCTCMPSYATPIL